MSRKEIIILSIMLVAIVFGLCCWGIVTVGTRLNEQPQEDNVSARFVVGEDNVEAIEIVYAQTHQRVSELILYKDDSGLARSGNQYIYINQSSCKIIVYRGE